MFVCAKNVFLNSNFECTQINIFIFHFYFFLNDSIFAVTVISPEEKKILKLILRFFILFY